MRKGLLVVILVVAALAALAVINAAAGPDQARTGFSIALAELPRPASASSDAPAQYDELMDPEFGCGGSGYHEYVDPG